MFIFLLVFLVIFAPVVNSPLGAFGDTSLLIASVLAFIIFFKQLQFDKSIRYFLYIFMSISVLSILNSFLISEQFDINSIISILKPIKGIIYFSAIYFILILIFHQHKTDSPSEKYEYILNLIYFCITIHALIIIAQFMLPSFLDFTYRWVVDQDVLDINKSFRMPGLTGAGGAQVAAVQGFGFLLGIHNLLIKKKWYIVFIFNAIILVSIIMTGRTGFILVFIGLLYWIFSVIMMVEKKKKMEYILIFMVTLIATLVSYNYLIDMFEGNDNFNRSFERAFRTYNNYQETGDFSDDTVEELSKMLNLPDTIGVILIGDGRQLNNTLGIYYSDIGYVRLWWSYGILGLLAFIFVYFLIGYYITKPFVIKVMGKQNVLFGVVMLFSIFILNYKEVFFLSRINNPILIFSTLGLYWLTYIDRKFLRLQTVKV